MCTVCKNRHWRLLQSHYWLIHIHNRETKIGYCCCSYSFSLILLRDVIMLGTVLLWYMAVLQDGFPNFSLCLVTNWLVLRGKRWKCFWLAWAFRAHFWQASSLIIEEKKIKGPNHNPVDRFFNVYFFIFFIFLVLY